MQREIFHYGFCFLLLFLAGCGNKPIYTSTWSSNEVVIDARLTDWKSEMMYDKKSKILYNIGNDGSNILLCFKITEPGVKNKIMMRGLTVWIDSTGKQKKALGIQYPMARRRIASPSGQMPPRQPDSSQQRERVDRSLMPDRLELIGFSEEVKSDIVAIDSAGGVEVAIMEDPFGGMQYEAKIPLKNIFTDPGLFISGPENFLSIGFETGYVKVGSNAQASGPGGRGGGGGGRPPGGGGGRPGGGRPGGMATQSGDMAGMTQPTRLWVKQIKLAISEKH